MTETDRQEVHGHLFWELYFAPRQKLQGHRHLFLSLLQSLARGFFLLLGVSLPWVNPPYGENHFYVEVRGLDGDKCIIYQRLEGPDVQKSLDRINELFDKSYKEFYIFCKIPRDVATQLSTDYSRIADYCNGPMVDQLKANTSSSNPD